MFLGICSRKPFFFRFFFFFSAAGNSEALLPQNLRFQLSIFHVFRVFLKTATIFFVIFWARGTINPAHRGPKATFFVFFLQRFSEVAPRQRTSRKYTFSDEKQVAVLEFLHFAKIHSMQRNHCVCCFVLRRNKKPKTKKQQKNMNFSKTALMFVHSWGTPFSCSSTYCDFGVPKQRPKVRL